MPWCPLRWMPEVEHILNSSTAERTIRIAQVRSNKPTIERASIDADVGYERKRTTPRARGSVMSEPDLLTLLATETLGDFACEEITLLGKSKPVYRMGSGPAVIVMSEMPGIYHHVA